MGNIYRTNNPLEYAEVDGIVIDEQAPSPGVNAVGANTAILVGQFERGLISLERISGIKDFHERYGKSSFSGNIQLKNKKFSNLKIIRAIAADAALGTLSISNATVPSIKFDAESKGVYGNKIKVTVEAGSVSGNKYTIQDTNTNASEFFPDEIYDNILIASVVADKVFDDSKLVDVSVLDTTTEPIATAITPLAAGSEGTIADTDYETAIAKAAAQGAGNVLFLDDYNQVRNGYLKIHVGLYQDKMVICSEEETDAVSDNETDVALLRDTDGRVIYASNWVETTIDGVSQYTSPAAWVASLFTLVAPNVDLAYSANSGFLFGITGIKKELTRIDYIALMEAGVCAFEFDSDIGFKLRSAVVTQIANTSKVTIIRRRMADFLTDTWGRFMKNYQNAPNSLSNRLASKGSWLSFLENNLEKNGILPKNNEVSGGLAKVVDIETENTDASIAEGKFITVYKQRIYSSMRFIVLKAEIGESVVVTEGE